MGRKLGGINEFDVEIGFNISLQYLKFYKLGYRFGHKMVFFLPNNQ